jgi:phenylalanyl-tRNA synthetase alpha chain
MQDDLKSLRADALSGVADAADLRALDAVRVAFLGKSGTLTALLKELGKTPPEERRARGAALNALKDEIAAALESRRTALEGHLPAAGAGSPRLNPSHQPDDGGNGRHFRCHGFRRRRGPRHRIGLA